MSRLIAFGDSFTYGSDLEDCVYNHSLKTWPALLSKHLNKEYVCHAYPGLSNDAITRTVFQNVSKFSKDDLVVVNWSWIDRTEVIQDNDWFQIRPDNKQQIGKLYYKHFFSEVSLKINALKNINLVQLQLQSLGIPYIMSCMDQLTLDQEWHCPPEVEYLQNNLDKLIWFNNKTFYEWSKDKGYPISDAMHPLEEAHNAAFEYIKNELT